MLAYDSLPGQLLALLQAGRIITVRWNCGGDESFVTTQLDGVEQPIDLGADYTNWRFAEYDDYKARMARLTNLPLLLDGFLTERLRLPSVGEFNLRGGGHILLENNHIILEFQSEATTWEDAPDPADWTPEYFLSPVELAELFPERRGIEVGPPGPVSPLPDPQMSADYSGREVLFDLKS